MFARSSRLVHEIFEEGLSADGHHYHCSWPSLRVEQPAELREMSYAAPAEHIMYSDGVTWRT